MQDWLILIERHAALVQALTSIASALISGAALVFALTALRVSLKQTNASVAMTTETFRPVMEITGGGLGEISNISFKNKGHGSALNFRYRAESEPNRWRSFTTNLIGPGEGGEIRGKIDWKSGLILSYNSVASRVELLTYVKFSTTGAVINDHVVNDGAAVTRNGWTLLDPSLAIPAYHRDLIASMPLRERVLHWWRLRTGKERRL